MFEQERSLLEARVQVFIQRLERLVYSSKKLFDAEYCIYAPPVDFENRSQGEFKPITEGDYWGENWQVAWFHLKGNVPKEWQGEKIAAYINLGGEALLFDSNGNPVIAFSCHSIFDEKFYRDRYIVAEKAKGNETFDFWIEATAAELFGLNIDSDPELENPKRFGEHKAKVSDLALAVFREDIWRLLLQVDSLNDIMKKLDLNSVRRARILKALMNAIDIFNSDRDSVAKSQKCLETELAKKSNSSALTAVTVGHAHLDTAWLWPLSETIRKCARTFSTQIRLMEKYPEYIFGASMPQHYAFVKKYYPNLFDEIKEKINQGQWEPQGGMWVEADCNLIGGEAMVRQILHGKNYFRDEFGFDVKNLWLPDVFGYSAALPQILKKSGIEYMVTQKLSWNQFNKMPSHTFVWKGLDDSEIIAHFPPEDTYNSNLKPSGLMYAQGNFKEKDELDEFLTLFGIGNGGGGPTEEMIERGLIQKDLESTPKVKFSSAQSMLDRLEKHRDQLMRWEGELYFELHRGTLTSQAYNKKMNRFMELKLRELEFLYSLVDFSQYPQSDLDEMWKKVLLYQFHDIIPGSSITKVYEDTRVGYKELEQKSAELYNKVCTLLTNENHNCVSLVNSLSFTFKKHIELPKSWCGYEILDEEQNIIPSQIVNGKPVILYDVESLGNIKVFRGQQNETADSKLPKELVMENELVRYEFDENGQICRAFDKTCHREILCQGNGNILSLYEDRPVNWDAWDVDRFYENQLLQNANLISGEWLDDGDVLQRIKFVFEIGTSKIEQFVILDSNSKRLDFVTKVDWVERHKMLRVAFPVNIISDTALFEIQYGSVKRNTHRNTSWDMARFEVAGHRFADLSEHDYGVALLNNCKYGYKVFGNTLDLNLLRATVNPDPEADRGVHEFTYSLLPHCGDFSNSDVIAEAAQLNQGISLIEGEINDNLFMPVQLKGNVILEVLKKSEKENAHIVRIYEPYGNRTTALIAFNKDVNVSSVNLMEDVIEHVSGKKIELHFKPFEIKTFKIA